MRRSEECRLWRRLAGCVPALALLLASLPAAAGPDSVLDSPKASKHFERAQAAFDREDYAAAIPELKAAYALEPNPMLLYAWAQAERFSGNCRRALELYKQFLAFDPAEEQRRLAEANVLDCQAELGEPAPTESPTDRTSTGPTSTDPDPPATPEAPAPRAPWYKDWLAPTLGGAGLAMVGGGAALVALSIRQGADSIDAITEMDYLAQGDAARKKHAAGWVLVGMGSALVVGGAIRYALLGLGVGKAGKSQARVRPGFSGTGASLSLRF